MNKKKTKQQKKQSQQRREQRRSERNKRKPGPTATIHEITIRLPSLDPPEPQRCFSPIDLDATGKPVPDPHVELGIPDTATAEQILTAFCARLLEHPPERDPEGARQLLAARERLLGPDRVLERALGVLHVPDPDAFGLPDATPIHPRLDVEARLVGQLALYALLEATLGDAARPQ
jgi:hypothetical protein